MRILISKSTKKVLKKLKNKDKKTYNRMRELIEEIESNPYHKKFESRKISPL